MSAVRASKVALRTEIKKKILLLSADEKQRQSEIVADKLFKLPAYKTSKRVSIYLSTDNEISTVGILKRLFDDQKLCYVPRYTPKSMEMIRLTSMSDYNNLPTTKWNIKQPNVTEIRENALETDGLDLILVPGVAFTPKGDRCGHGKGYYDTFFKSLGQENLPTIIGLAFKQQIVEDLPISEHDYRLDAILYDGNE